MLNQIKELCNIDAPSGNESAVREYILKNIPSDCDVTVDHVGNVIVFKKGKNAAKHKISIDAHMDEVGVIATSITPDGFIKFTTVGGIETESLVSKRVRFLNGTVGIIGIKHGHLCDDKELHSFPSKNSLLIDIGAKNREEAERNVLPGDTAVYYYEFEAQGDYIISKALDDRIGCGVVLRPLNEDSDYDFTATFTIGEEIGLVGGKTVTETVKPEATIVIEATTAGDIGNADDSECVCKVGGGAVVSFMDRSTLYDKKLFDAALNAAKEQGIKCQSKNAVAGGNNAGAIHQSAGGVRPLAISAPCRYIHSPSSVVNIKDIEAVYALAKVMLSKLASGEIW